MAGIAFATGQDEFEEAWGFLTEHLVNKAAAVIVLPQGSLKDLHFATI